MFTYRKKWGTWWNIEDRQTQWKFGTFRKLRYPPFEGTELSQWFPFSPKNVGLVPWKVISVHRSRCFRTVVWRLPTSLFKRHRFLWPFFEALRQPPITNQPWTATLPETNSEASYPWKLGRNPKDNDRLPTIHFQVRAVSFREGTVGMIGGFFFNSGCF